MTNPSKPMANRNRDLPNWRTLSVFSISTVCRS